MSEPDPTTQKLDAYGAGWEARSMGQARTAPYDGDLGRLWLMGWDEAQKLWENHQAGKALDQEMKP